MLVRLLLGRLVQCVAFVRLLLRWLAQCVVLIRLLLLLLQKLLVHWVKLSSKDYGCFVAKLSWQ